MKHVFLLTAFVILATMSGVAQQIKINFANNLIDSSNNHYLIDTNNCGNVLTFCDDASGNANNAYLFDGQCGMATDSFSMTNTVYNGFSVSFYVSKNFDSSAVQYGILHFYKGNFLIYAVHDSMFITITDSTYNDHTFGVPCNIPNNEWCCVVVTCTDYGSVDFYFNKNKIHAGTAAFKSLRKECVTGFCYPLHISTDIWNNEFFKGKLDDIRVWNWPSDSVNVDEICNKSIVPAAVDEQWMASVQIYPNPVDNELYIDIDESASLELFDVTGRLILRQQLSTGKNRVNMTSVSPGIVFALIKTNAGSYSTKVWLR